MVSICMYMVNIKMLIALRCIHTVLRKYLPTVRTSWPRILRRRCCGTHTNTRQSPNRLYGNLIYSTKVATKAD